MSLSYTIVGNITWHNHPGGQLGNNYWDVKYWYECVNNLNSKHLSYGHVYSDTKGIYTICLV